MIWATSLALMKLSILFFHSSLFGAHPIFRKAATAISAIVAMWWPSVILCGFLMCRPFAFSQYSAFLRRNQPLTIHRLGSKRRLWQVRPPNPVVHCHRSLEHHHRFVCPFLACGYHTLTKARQMSWSSYCHYQSFGSCMLLFQTELP